MFRWNELENENARNMQMKRALIDAGIDEGPITADNRTPSEPVSEMKFRMNEAIHFLSDYRAFGEALPYSGGLRNQPLNWVIPMRCILRAEQDAEADKRGDAQPEPNKEEWPTSDERGERAYG